MLVVQWFLIVSVSLTLVLDGHRVRSAAIPIWELLGHQEKMGRLFYVFVHLVDQYCKTSDIPDCPKVLTLYGMSNLVSEDEHSLDLMDPYQRDAKTIVWEKIMRGEFKLPTNNNKVSPSKTVGGKTSPGNNNNKLVGIDNDVYSSPYEIRVRPPTDYVAPDSSSSTAPAELAAGSLRLGRSLPADGPTILSEQDAQLLLDPTSLNRQQ